MRMLSPGNTGTGASSALQSAVNYAWNKGAVIFSSAGNGAGGVMMVPPGL